MHLDYCNRLTTDKGLCSQSCGFSSSHVQIWELDHKKKAEHQRTDAFELWCWRRLLRAPWTVRRSNKSLWKEIKPEYSSEGLMWNWSSNTLATWCEKLTHWKISWFWERLRAGGEGGDKGWDGDSIGMSLGKLQEIVKKREAWCAAVHGFTKCRTRLSNNITSLPVSICASPSQDILHLAVRWAVKSHSFVKNSSVYFFKII